MDGVIEEAWRGERRGRLLEAAARVFARHPYDQASMDEIAHEAGSGKPTLYRYFPSKDALFAAVFVQALDELDERLHAVLRRESGIEARMKGLVGALVPTFRDHLVPLRLLAGDAAAAGQSRRRIFRDRRARIAGFLASAIEAGIRDGELRDIDAARVSQLVVGMIWSGTATMQAPPDEIAGEIVDLLINGLAAPAQAGPRHAPARRDRSWPEDRAGDRTEAARPYEAAAS